jgi:hypothetical protein
MDGVVPSRGDIRCKFRGLWVRVTDSGFAHLYKEDITPLTLCDMLIHTMDCPKGKKGKPHSRNAIQVCAVRKGRIYIILLVKETANDTREQVYSVVHLKPVA